jgi:hypothetical protein
MKIRITLFAACLLFCIQVKAQITVSYSFGYGEYNMAGMKDILNSFANTSPILPGIDLRLVDNFPGCMNHSINLSYKAGRMEYGVRSAFLTTGGKLAYADYSGIYEQKILLRGFQEGLFCRYYFGVIPTGKKSYLTFYGELSPNVLFGQIKHELYLGLQDGENMIDDDQAMYNINSASVTVMPLLGTKFFINHHIGIHLSGGYDWDILAPQLKIKAGDYSDNATPDWSGLRIFGGLSYTF